MRLRATLLAVATGGTLAACGGGEGSPTPSTPLPAPTPVNITVTAVDGRTDDPVTTLTATQGQRVRIEAEGYLVRSRTAAPRIDLWPATEEQRRAIKRIVYERDGEPRALYRWRQGFTVEGTDVRVPYVPEGPGVVTVKVDPTDEYFAEKPRVIAFCRRWIDGATITRADVILRDQKWLTWNWGAVVVHELGHAAGLNHIDDPSFAMMSPAHHSRFNETERVALHMMYAHRLAGNEFPDAAPRLGVSAGGVRVEVVE